MNKELRIRFENYCYVNDWNPDKVMDGMIAALLGDAGNVKAEVCVRLKEVFGTVGYVTSRKEVMRHVREIVSRRFGSEECTRISNIIGSEVLGNRFQRKGKKLFPLNLGD